MRPQSKIIGIALLAAGGAVLPLPAVVPAPEAAAQAIGRTAAGTSPISRAKTGAQRRRVHGGVHRSVRKRVVVPYIDRSEREVVIVTQPTPVPEPTPAPTPEPMPAAVPHRARIRADGGPVRLALTIEGRGDTAEEVARDLGEKRRIVLRRLDGTWEDFCLARAGGVVIARNDEAPAPETGAFRGTLELEVRIGGVDDPLGVVAGFDDGTIAGAREIKPGPGEVEEADIAQDRQPGQLVLKRPPDVAGSCV